RRGAAAAAARAAATGAAAAAGGAAATAGGAAATAGGAAAAAGRAPAAVAVRATDAGDARRRRAGRGAAAASPCDHRQESEERALGHASVQLQIGRRPPRKLVSGGTLLPSASFDT